MNGMLHSTKYEQLKLRERRRGWDGKSIIIEEFPRICLPHLWNFLANILCTAQATSKKKTYIPYLTLSSEFHFYNIYSQIATFICFNWLCCITVQVFRKRT